MATKKEEQGLRFEFGSGDDLALNDKGEFWCQICYKNFVVPHCSSCTKKIDVTIRGFSICPSCIKSGPAAVATEAERIAGSKKRIARWGEENPEDAKGLASEYLLLAQMLRRLDSFRDIPGGAVAVVIVPVKPEDLRPSRRRKAA